MFLGCGGGGYFLIIIFFMKVFRKTVSINLSDSECDCDNDLFVNHCLIYTFYYKLILEKLSSS